MTDLVEDLIDSLKAYDVTMSHWGHLRQGAPGNLRDGIDRLLHTYLCDKVATMRRAYGIPDSDLRIANLQGEPVTNILVRAGRLHPSPLVDALVIYGAHLAAVTSYGDAAWRAVTEVVVVEAAFQELTR